MDKKLLIVLGTLFSSTSAVFVRSANAPAVTVAFYRMCLAALILLPIVLVKNRRELFSLSRRNLLLSILSGLFLGLHFTCYFSSLEYTSISSATTLSCVEVFFVAFALVFIFKEKVSAKSWLGIVIAFIGSVIIAFHDLGNGKNLFRGDMLALLASLLVSCYTILGKVVRRDVTTNTYTLIVYAAASLTVGCVGLIGGTPIFDVSGRTLLCTAGLAVFCTLLGHSIFSWGLKYLQASYVSNVKMLSPVFATIWGFVLFKEIPGLGGAIGCLTVIAGVIIYSNNISEKKV